MSRLELWAAGYAEKVTGNDLEHMPAGLGVALRQMIITSFMAGTYFGTTAAGSAMADEHCGDLEGR